MPKRSLYIPAYIGITLISITLLAVGCNQHPAGSPANQTASQVTPSANQSAAQPDSQATVQTAEDIYTCPMHPQVMEHHPGNCPICGMTLVKKEFSTAEAKNSTVDLHTLLQPTNSAVVSGIPVTALLQTSQSLPIEVLGRVDYDTRRVQTISARISGRIEKLYVKYRYQHVHMG